ncbi:sugar transferase, partial [Klebsiella pneumoniae]|nr:sugar transferase [Klebsiella pneumoniae]
MEERNLINKSATETIDTVRKQNVLYLLMKRAIDIVGAIIGLIIFSPFFIIIPILYMRGEGKGPVFFRQSRIGQNGETFGIYKFRSMVIDAEKKLK